MLLGAYSVGVLRTLLRSASRFSKHAFSIFAPFCYSRFLLFALFCFVDPIWPMLRVEKETGGKSVDPKHRPMTCDAPKKYNEMLR